VIDGKRYGVTEKFGYNTIGFNKAKVSVEDMQSLAALTSDKYKGRIAIYDYYLPVIGMAATSRAANMPAYLEHDKDFHLTLLQASGNPMLAGLSTVVTSVLEGRTEHALMPAVADAEALRLHGEVAAAVQAGAGAAAEASMRAIVAESADAIEQAVSS